MRSRMILVALCAALAATIALPAGGFAAAQKFISGNSIKKGSIKLNRLSAGTQRLIRKNGATGKTGVRGRTGAIGQTGETGKTGANTGVDSAHWGVINRNVIGSGIAQLRSGPGSPPAGRGSLNIDTANPESKVSYGNDTDFKDKKIADINQLSYWVFQTGENKAKAAGNAPTLNIEVDPNKTASNYSSLVFVPPVLPEGWSQVDAAAPTSAPSSGFYFTNASTADATHCTQATYCSLSEVKTRAPDAVITLSLGLNKGRDYEFHGAVDELQVNTKHYDFEESGVR